jgi:hypothetical protein
MPQGVEHAVGTWKIYAKVTSYEMPQGVEHNDAGNQIAAYLSAMM